MTCAVLMAVLLSEMTGAAMLWASLFFAACILVIVLRFKLAVEQKRAQDLEYLVDFSARRRRTAMELFHTLGSAFESSISLENLLRATVAFFMRIAQATGGIIYMVEPKEKKLHAAAMCGTLGGMIGRSREEIDEFAEAMAVGEGVVGEVALSGRPVFINDCVSDPRLNFLGGETLKIENAMAVPLKFRDHSLGVLVVINRMGEDGTVGKTFGRFEFQLLEAMAVYAATAIYLTLSYLEQSEKQRLDFDLQVASEIQQLLLPQHSPVVPGTDIAGRSRPAYRVGGDHYDFIKLQDSLMGVVIADVSGKGVTGALVMAICHAIVRSHAAAFTQSLDAVKLFRKLLVSDIPEDRFVTMIYGIINPNRREFTFTRAGHDPMLCYRRDSSVVEVLSPRGGAIGLVRGDRFDRNLEQQTVTLAAGDAIVLFTDGITETLDPNGEEFGLQRLTRLIADNGNLNANDLLDAIFREVETFARNAPAVDDQTVVVIKFS